MVTTIRQTVENAIYAYNPDEFFPVFRDGELDNRGEFIAYKAEKLAGALGRAAHQAVEVTMAAGSILLAHIAE